MSKFKLECHEANHICDKNQYKEASFKEKIILTFHLIYCRACREYTKRNVQLTKLMGNKKVSSMNNMEKDNLQHSFEKELANHK